jgi:hypothetical protein
MRQFFVMFAVGRNHLKIESISNELKLIPENDMDLFHIGVISQKVPCSFQWVNKKIKDMAMTSENLVSALARKDNIEK